VEEHLTQILLWILPILAAVVFHEVAHGFVARALGDSTAERAGRLTLNPLAHVDPVGTVIIPIVLLITDAGFLFGWAKPVPVDYSALRNPRRDMVLVAAAGPATNLVLAIFAALVVHAVRSLGLDEAGALSRAVLNPLVLMAQRAVLMNVFLAVFNLLPIPPLDGGRVLTGLLPLGWARTFHRVEPYGFLILVALMMTHSLGRLVGPPIQLLLGLLL
jgi:Zn-dependent protease